MSCMIILGLGGKKYTKEHIDGTVRVINACAPNYVGALTLYLENGIKQEFLDKYNGEFERISDSDALDELERLVRGIDVDSNVIFRANHGSNAFYVNGISSKQRFHAWTDYTYERKSTDGKTRRIARILDPATVYSFTTLVTITEYSPLNMFTTFSPSILTRNLYLRSISIQNFF